MPQYGGYPWLSPLYQLLNGKDKPGWGPPEKGVLSLLCTQGVWTSDRLCSAGYKQDDLCTSCLLPDSVDHLLFKCEGTLPFRQQYDLHTNILTFKEQHPHLPLWHSCIIEDPTIFYPSPTVEPIVHWVVGNAELGFDEPSFGNGSGKFRLYGEHMPRCGWSVFSGSLLVKSAWAQGPLPLRVQSTPGAELYALYVYLKHAIPYQGMYVFHSDNSYVVDSFNHKTKHCLCNGWVVHANSWTRFFEIIDDIGRDHVYVLKVKAHTKLHDGMTQYEKLCVIGNDLADKGAKAGVEYHPVNTTLREHVKNFRLSFRAVCKFMVKACLAGFKARPKFEKGARFQLSAPSSRPLKGHLSSINLASGRNQCRVCYVSSANTLKGKCHFAAQTSMHCMWSVGPFTFCCDCGAHTRVSLRKLALSCPRKVTTS